MAVVIPIVTRDESTRVLGNVNRNVKRVNRSITQGATKSNTALASVRANWIAVTAAVAGVAVVVNRAFAFATQAAAVEEQFSLLNRLLSQTGESAEGFVKDLQDITNGQLSFADATKLANQALQAGFTTEAATTFAQLADALGDVQGTSVAETFDKIVKGIAKGRPTLLANIGILVDTELETDRLAKATGRTTTEITKLERQQIALNSVLRQAPVALERFTTAAVSDADQLAALQARWEDLTLTIGNFSKRLILGIPDLIAVLRAPREAGQELAEIFLEARRIADQTPEQRGAEQEAQGRQIVLDTQKQLLEQERQLTQERERQTRLLREQEEEIERGEEQRQRGLQLQESFLQRINIQTQQRAQLEKAINTEIANQQNLLGQIESTRQQFEQAQAQREFEQLDPEEQFQSLRRAAEEAGGDVQKLIGILNQAQRLDVEGIDQFIRRLQFDIPFAFDAAEAAARENTQNLTNLLKPVTDQTADLGEALQQAARVFNEISPNAPIIALMDNLVAKAAQAEEQIRQLIATLAAAGTGGGGGGLGEATGQGFQTGTRRIRRTGIALLHEGEAVVPEDRNFLDPRISRQERQERLAKLATGSIPSFQFGGVVGGSANLGGFGTLAGFELLRSGGRIPIPRFRTLESQQAFAFEKLEQLERELQAARELQADAVTRGTLGFFSGRVGREAQTSESNANALRGQLEQLARQGFLRGGGAGQFIPRNQPPPQFQEGGGDVGGGGRTIVINVNIGGNSLVTEDAITKMIREQVVPQLTEIA